MLKRSSIDHEDQNLESNNLKEFSPIQKNNYQKYFLIWSIFSLLLNIGLWYFLFLVYRDVWDLENDMSNNRSSITALQAKQEPIIITATYYGKWSSFMNNVDRLWDKSLSLPIVAKWKTCYILWSKISWVAGWTIRWFLWKDNNANDSSFSIAENYEASINTIEEKIEIQKRNGYSNSNLTEYERNNLYFAISLLCK